MKYIRILVGLGLLAMLLSPPVSRANATDAWWNEAWPYRIPVTVSGSGVAQVSINFTIAFDTLGLSGGLLDVRSIRVVPYNGTTPGSPIPYAETYSAVLHDAETTSGWSLNSSDNGGSVSNDSARFSQGSKSVKAFIDNKAGGYGYPGVEYHPSTITDWHNYESFIYDVWPAVNASALDQAPDLYYFKLYNTSGCASSITQGSPPLALGRWNYVSVSLKPFDTCTTPSFSNITRMEFHTRDNVSGDLSGPTGLWDDGDQLTLWFDNLRLVDQDGGGVIKWNADGSTNSYYLYFDTLAHEGHPQPALTSLGAATLTGTAGLPEAGGYFHLVTGAGTGSLAVWAAPPVEKILKTNATPVTTAPLRISAAQDEFEPFQLVVRSASAQNLAVNISAFTKGSDTIPAANVTLHRVDYVTLTKLSDSSGRLVATPDPLYPLVLGSSVSFLAGSNQPLWVTVHVPRTAAPGVYNAMVTIGTATIPVELEVWNFTLPQTIHLAGEWGFDWSNIVEQYKGTIGGSVQPCYWNLVDALYEDFADHRLTPKGVGWPAGLNLDDEYCDTGVLDPNHGGNIWYFNSTAQKYLSGGALDNGVGFPSFLIRGPASNDPPNSRPSTFCELSRDTDPPGNSKYNTKWFQYWTAVSNYLGSTSDYASKGYYHIVNEPQTLTDYNIVAYLAKQTKTAAPNVRLMVSEQVEAGIYNNAKIDIWLPTITNYEPEKSHDRQLNHNEQVWWYFLYGDRPPLPNPTIIDRPGLEARITPWLAWLERVQGLLYYATTDWSPSPWTQPWSNNSSNGDAVMFYPPKDSTLAFDACNAQSNRLVPSIRWELLREGMEDYEYLWLLNKGQPQIGVSNQSDTLAGQFIQSRTLFSRVPTDLYATRAVIAAKLTGPSASVATSKPGVPQNGTFNYLLVYHAGDTAHTVTISDTVPITTTVLGASGSKSPTPGITGQLVNWTVALASQETVTLTIQAQAGSGGLVNNRASFTGPEALTASASVLVYTNQVFLPVILK